MKEERRSGLTFSHLLSLIKKIKVDIIAVLSSSVASLYFVPNFKCGSLQFSYDFRNPENGEGNDLNFFVCQVLSFSLQTHLCFFLAKIKP